MSIFSPGLEKALKGQKQALISEAEKAGARIVQIEDVTDSAENAGKRVMGSSAKVLFGGKMKADGFQLYVLETDGLRHVYVQPFTGGLPLPGEHHVMLDGVLPGALTAEETFFSTEWQSADNAAFAKQLNGDAAMKKLVKKLEWNWPMGAGKIELKWTAQTKTTATGDTHFVMKPGRYGGLMTYAVGFDVFVGMMQGLQAQTTSDGARETMFAQAPSYSDWAGQLLGVEREVAQADDIAEGSSQAKQQVDLDYRAIVRTALNGKTNKRIFLSDIPEKKLNNARKGILPEGAKDAEIVALFDDTVFKSAKDGVIITPDMFYVSEFDETISFPLRDLQVVGAINGGKISVKVAVKGELMLPGGIEDGAVHATLQAIADANHA